MIPIDEGAWLDTVRPALGSARLARAAWTRVCEPGDKLAAALVAQLGPVEALAGLCHAGSGHFHALASRTLGVDFAALFRFAQAHQVRPLVPEDPDWPAGLDDLAYPPIALWCKGSLSLQQSQERSVAVVGARAATPYGMGIAHQLGAGIAAAGFLVVSGAAYGIDAQAHEGALAADGDTVAILAGGLDRPYPSGNAGLIARIAARGALLSEVSPGGAPTKSRFLQRNRLIATMSRAVLVVEAGLRSGSLHTARLGAEHHRPVGVVPGPVTSRASAGCHQMIRDGGATLVTDTAEALDLVAQIGQHTAVRRSAPSRVEDRLAEGDRAVLAALPIRAPVTVEQVAAFAGVDPAAARAALGRMQLLGLVLRREDRWQKAPARRAG